MAEDVTIGILQHDEQFPDGTARGRWKLTHQLSSGGAVTQQLVAAATLTAQWAALPSETYDMTLVALDAAETGTLGPLITKRNIRIGTPTPPAPPADTDPPVVSWDNPTQGEFVEGLVEFQFTASDGSGIGVTEIKINTVVHTIGTPWDTTGLTNGDVVTLDLRVQDLATPTPNETTVTITVVIDNPVIPPPTPTPGIKRAIQLELDERGRVRYALWIPVPTALQATFAATAPASSVWTLSSAAEDAAIVAGEIREVVGMLDRSRLTDEETETALETLWSESNADMQTLAAWVSTIKDSYWPGGETWQKD